MNPFFFSSVWTKIVQTLNFRTDGSFFVDCQHCRTVCDCAELERTQLPLHNTILYHTWDKYQYTDK